MNLEKSTTVIKKNTRNDTINRHFFLSYVPKTTIWVPMDR